MHASHFEYVAKVADLHGAYFGDEAVAGATLPRRASSSAPHLEILTAEDAAAKKAIDSADEAERQAKLAEMRFHAALKKAQEAQELQKKFYIPGVGDDDDMPWLNQGIVKAMVADIERLKNYKFARKKAILAEEEVNRQLAEFELAREAYRKAQDERKVALEAQKQAAARAAENLRTMTDEERVRRLTKFAAPPPPPPPVEEKDKRGGLLGKLDREKLEAQYDKQFGDDGGQSQLDLDRAMNMKIEAAIRAAAEASRKEEEDRKREAARQEAQEKLKLEAGGRSEDERRARKSSILAAYDRAKFDEQVKTDPEPVALKRPSSASRLSFTMPAEPEPEPKQKQVGRLSLSAAEMKHVRDLEEKEAERRSSKTLQVDEREVQRRLSDAQRERESGTAAIEAKRRASKIEALRAIEEQEAQKRSSPGGVGRLTAPALGSEYAGKGLANVGHLVIPELKGHELPPKPAPRVGKLSLGMFQPAPPEKPSDLPGRKLTSIDL